MAREYRLPKIIRHFIESHHGTTLVEFFYHAAKKKHDEENIPPPTEFEFRYPGPKPQNREAAILMLCDATESASRSLDEPNHANLQKLVHDMAMKRLMDGQFDDCNLTLQELNRIEQSLVKTLSAIYHSRIKYPSDAATLYGQAAPSDRTDRLRRIAAS
jgi:membrane-associated HD superfamily phosphohydrolase